MRGLCRGESSLPNNFGEPTAFDRSLFIHQGSDFYLITELTVNARPVFDLLGDLPAAWRFIGIRDRYAASKVVFWQRGSIGTLG